MLTAVAVSLLVLLVVLATFAMLVVGLEGHLADRMPRLAHRARAAALVLNGEMEEFEAMTPLAPARPRRAVPTRLARVTAPFLTRASALLHRTAPEGQPSH